LLERIAKEIKKDGVVDHDSFRRKYETAITCYDHALGKRPGWKEAFASAGGFGTINKSFSSRLPEPLETLHSEI